MAQCGHDTSEQHGRVGVGDRGEEIACDKEHEQAHEYRFAGQPGHSGSHQQGTDSDAEGVTGDEPTGRSLADVEVGGNLGQEAHDHEFGQSDAESAEGKGNQPCGHVELLRWPVPLGSGSASPGTVE
ncbi:hypothetical protein PJL18_02389 [Paenarthrobacter nicotinovorans]|nr:hypothetical protein [Paenarthrobacter nicotinovorans]